MMERLERVAALTLAVVSHGPKPGKDADRCFPARADHFLRWIRTGNNEYGAAPEDVKCGEQ